MKDVYTQLIMMVEALLERDNSVSVPNRTKWCLAIELYKVFNGICPEIMKDVFLFLNS